jgi:hypothetical protein
MPARIIAAAARIQQHQVEVLCDGGRFYQFGHLIRREDEVWIGEIDFRGGRCLIGWRTAAGRQQQRSQGHQRCYQGISSWHMPSLLIRCPRIATL